MGRWSHLSSAKHRKRPESEIRPAGKIGSGMRRRYCPRLNHAFLSLSSTLLAALQIR